MTVHTSGTFGVTTTDFQTTHKGVQIAIKVIAWTGQIPVIAIAEKKTEGWQATYILFEFDDVTIPEQETAKAGGTVNWIKTVLVPKINAALLLRFPKATTVVAGSLQDIDAKLGTTLAWSPQTDGTLKVIVK